MKTIAPIQFVPYIVLYVNGTPFMRYTGQKTEESIGQFVVEMLNRLGPQIQKSFGARFETDEILEYTKKDQPIPFNIICDKELCYLTTNELNNGVRKHV
jgi:thioredoxin-like negative regulator of GroEL